MSKSKSRTKASKSAKAARPAKRTDTARRKPATGAVDVLFSAPTLLDHARDAWHRADWPALAALAEHPVEDEAERARLALLVAAGLAQQDRLDTARRLARQALDWGASERLAAQVLISGVYTTLGRAALAQGNADDAPALFRAALLDMEPDEDRRQAAADRRLEAERHRLTAAPAPEADPVAEEPPAPCLANAEERFRTLLPDWQPDSDLPCLIETKSLPRSGLHFLKSCFETALPGRFSFCEWYAEPGCCRRQPCAVPLFDLEAASGADALRPLRMVKSHDFAGKDASYDPPPGVMRLILVRDPLMVLTSWWALEELVRHRDLLASHGIQVEKLFYLHEKPLLQAAYKVVEADFHPVPPGAVEDWLARKSAYVLRFLRKWAGGSGPQVQVVNYDELPGFIAGFFASRQGALTASEEAGLARMQNEKLARYAPRNAPFEAPIRQITDTLNHHKTLFLDTSDTIRNLDDSGHLHTGPSRGRHH